MPELKKSNKPKIIFSSYDDLKNPYYGGGGAYAVHEVAKRLVKKFDITVLTGKYPGCRSQRINGVKYKRIGLSCTGPKLDQMIFHFFLPFYVLKEDFQIWVENFTPPYSTSFLQLLTRKPVIGLVHMLSSDYMQRKYKLPFHIIQNLGLKKYKYLIVLTEEMKNRISAVNPKAKIKVIPNGIDLIKTKQNNSNNKKYILFIGRIDVHLPEIFYRTKKIIYHNKTL